jgi:hypothetical protein
MSWRRFVALMTGLSTRSRWVLSLRTDRKGRGEVRRIDDPKAAEAYFASIGA